MLKDMARTRFISIINILSGKVVQSYNFKKYLPIGHPKIAIDYMNNWGVDEIMLLDIKNSLTKKNFLINNLKKLTKNCQTPLAAGGGIESIKQVEKIIKTGADKVVLNSGTLINKSLIRQSSREFGSQAVIYSLDIKKEKDRYYIYKYSGTKKIYIDIFNHLKEIQEEGAGEILINSINNDGSGKGFDIKFLKKFKKFIHIPIILCGGYGNVNHLTKIFDLDISGFGIGNYVHHCEHSVKLIKKKIFDTYGKKFVRFDNKFNYLTHQVNSNGRLKG